MSFHITNDDVISGQDVILTWPADMGAVHVLVTSDFDASDSVELWKSMWETFGRPAIRDFGIVTSPRRYYVWKVDVPVGAKVAFAMSPEHDPNAVHRTAVYTVLKDPGTPIPNLRLMLEDGHLVHSTGARPVAAGSFCDVFQVVFAPTGLTLALKRARRIMRDTTGNDQGRRMAREVRVWLALKHRNILPCYGILQDDLEVDIITPWMSYGDLAHVLLARPVYAHLSPQQRAEHPLRAALERFDEMHIIVGIAKGLAYLHNREIIHGDVRCSNVLLDATLEPMLCDFGLSKLAGNEETSTAMKGVGSMSWMAPELLDNAPKGRETDIYGLGMTIGEVLTGNTPFSQLYGAADKIRAIVSGRDRPFPEAAYDEASLWPLHSACVDRTPGNRPTANDVLGPDFLAVSSGLVDEALQPEHVLSPWHEPVDELVISPEEDDIWENSDSAMEHFDGTTPTLSLTDSDKIVLSPKHPVGGGGFCDLFRGVFTPTKSILALKRPLRRKTASQTENSFHQEADLWRTLIHPNILPFLGIVELRNEAYLVSPWIRNGDLATFTAERSAGRRSAANFDERAVVIGMASGLAYLHSQNVVHGDVKAGNILLGHGMQPLFCDFGISTVAMGSNTTEGPCPGTICWMGPELFNGERPSKPSDIYAFGLTVGEVVTGTRPYIDRRNSGAICKAIITGTPLPFTEVNAHPLGCPSLWNLVKKCIQREPSERPTARDISEPEQFDVFLMAQ